MTDNTPIQFSNDDRQLLRQIAGIVQETHFRVSSLEDKFSSFEVRFSSLEDRFSFLEGRVLSLEIKVDERLHDTRPMWEALNARLDRFETETRERFDRIETRLERMGAKPERQTR